MLYIFKSNNGDIEVVNERLAHNRIKNRGSWERQDMYFHGGVGEEVYNKCLSLINEKKKEVKDTVFLATSQAKMLLDEIELAKMKKDEETLKIKEMELKIQRNNFDNVIKDRSGNEVNEEHDQWRNNIIIGVNKVTKEELNALEGDRKIVPRDMDVLYNGAIGGAIGLVTEK